MKRYKAKKAWARNCRNLRQLWVEMAGQHRWVDLDPFWHTNRWSRRDACIVPRNPASQFSLAT